MLVMFDRANPVYEEFNRVIERLAPSLHLQRDVAAVATAAELEQAIASFADAPGGGLIVMGGTVASAHREKIIALAERQLARAAREMPPRSFLQRRQARLLL